MSKYRETYINLYHGTTSDAAKQIVSSQRFVESSDSSWCGAGTYFYDNKAKALWAANRKYEEIHAKTGIKCRYTYVNVDIIDLDRAFILDLRSYKDLAAFAEFVDQILAESDFDIDGDLDTNEKLIWKRALLISLYAQEQNKKLVIGHFRQIANPMFVDVQASADKLQLVVGVETIYCVKDGSIISNIRGAQL